MKRRGALKVMTVVAGTSVLLPSFSACRSSGYEPVFFSKQELSLVEEVSETILPRTPDAPGARDCQVANFVDAYINDCYSIVDQESVKSGLENLKASCEEKYKKQFEKLSKDLKEGFLTDLDPRTKTGESMAPSVSNDIIQDLTYAAILKDYGPDADRTINRPEPYDPSLFYCSCEDKCTDVEKDPHPCLTMLNYGKLPNGKYMINWPLSGNDYYVNSIDMNKAEREIAFANAKQKTLQFIYYIQTELGYKNIGIADDEFPTSDGLPLMPYHREGRRIHGMVQLTVNSIIDPYSDHLYRTGIAVGDYPIDHHHFERLDAPEINFPKVPSFSIPMGSLIPKDRSHILIADKAISVTNIVNGSSRLQPVIIQLGQAAGLMAALSANSGVPPHELDVRTIQQHLLQAKGYIMPFIDVSPVHSNFQSIQRVAASGLLRGHGVPFKWANQTWFYPDSLMTKGEFRKGWTDFAQTNRTKTKDVDFISLQYVLEQVSGYDKRGIQQLEDLLSTDTKIDQSRFDRWSQQKGLTKADVALILDVLLQPFDRDVDIHGEWKQKL